jgi:hypothetical protein
MQEMNSGKMIKFRPLIIIEAHSQQRRKTFVKTTKIQNKGYGTFLRLAAIGSPLLRL